MSDPFDAFFGSQLDPDPTGGLALLADGIHAVGPRLLAILDAGGEILGAWGCDDREVSPERADAVRAEAAALHLRASETGDLQESTAESSIAAHRFAVAARPGADVGDGADETRWLVGWSERGPEDGDRGSAEWEALTIAARFALRCHAVGHRTSEMESRIRHLRNERAILNATNATNVAAMLDARERQIHQHREYATRLEREVDERSSDLKEALAQAEAASEAKSTFLANMSHEIRTPMTAILGFVDLILEPDVARDDLEEYAGVIAENGQRLLHILDGILDISSIETGHLRIEPAEVSIRELIEEEIALIAPRAREQEISLNRNLGDDVPSRFLVDRGRLRQILHHLVDNAVKFTKRGSVTIRGSWRLADEVGYLTLEVIDTGIGMTEEELSHLFVPFAQVDASSTREFGGAGVGLALARRVARLLGGDLTAQSVVDRGSTFRVTIPVDPLSGDGSEPAPGPSSGDTAAKPIQSDLSGDEDLVEIIRGFVDEFPHRVAEMDHHLENDDLGSLANLADRVREEGSAIGFPVLANEGGNLELDCRNGDRDAIRNRVAAFHRLAHRLAAPDGPATG